jgi:spermidine synthase
MDEESTLESVDNDVSVVAIARRHLGSDPRVTFSVQDGSAFLKVREGKYDLIFADYLAGQVLGS